MEVVVAISMPRWNEPVAAPRQAASCADATGGLKHRTPNAGAQFNLDSAVEAATKRHKLHKNNDEPIRMGGNFIHPGGEDKSR